MLWLSVRGDCADQFAKDFSDHCALLSEMQRCPSAKQRSPRFVFCVCVCSDRTGVLCTCIECLSDSTLMRWGVEFILFYFILFFSAALECDGSCVMKRAENVLQTQFQRIVASNEDVRGCLMFSHPPCQLSDMFGAGVFIFCVESVPVALLLVLSYADVQLGTICISLVLSGLRRLPQSDEENIPCAQPAFGACDAFVWLGDAAVATGMCVDVRSVTGDEVAGRGGGDAWVGQKCFNVCISMEQIPHH
jgi:hypothetical protein